MMIGGKDTENKADSPTVPTKNNDNRCKLLASGHSLNICVRTADLIIFLPNYFKLVQWHMVQHRKRIYMPNFLRLCQFRTSHTIISSMRMKGIILGWEIFVVVHALAVPYNNVCWVV